MPVRGCTLVAIEGTHASGKTTLTHALVAHYRARGTLVACTAEPARTSPFIEEIVIYGKGNFDLTTEVDLFATQLSTQLRATRHQQLLICDKTIMNVLAYARLVLDPRQGHTADVLEALTSLCRAWAPSAYDAVIYCPDQYQQPADMFRSKVSHLQDATATAVRQACTDTGITLHELPAGLDLNARVAWVSSRVDPLLTGASR